MSGCVETSGGDKRGNLDSIHSSPLDSADATKAIADPVEAARKRAAARAEVGEEGMFYNVSSFSLPLFSRVACCAQSPLLLPLLLLQHVLSLPCFVFSWREISSTLHTWWHCSYPPLVPFIPINPPWMLLSLLVATQYVPICLPPT